MNTPTEWNIGLRSALNMFSAKFAALEIYTWLQIKIFNPVFAWFPDLRVVTRFENNVFFYSKAIVCCHI